MDFAKVPVGFSMALAQNSAALEKYSSMTQSEKQAVISKARNVKSDTEMRQLVDGLCGK